MRYRTGPESELEAARSRRVAIVLGADQVAQVCLSCVCTLQQFAVTFPALQLGNMHWDRQSRVASFLGSPERPSHRSSSAITRSSSPSSIGSHSDFAANMEGNRPPIILGICAMDIKARSKAMREILTRLVEMTRGTIEVKVFGDKVILDEGTAHYCLVPTSTPILTHLTDVENWPTCDILISFFSTDFPLDKAISYVKLRNPHCINELVPQALLWDRRLVGNVLDHLKVPTPKRLEVSRDGGPKVDGELKLLMKQRLGVDLGGFQVTPEVSLREDGNAIIIDGQVMEKPFVEKPVSGEDHNVYIYFRGGGGRRLFRKVILISSIEMHCSCAGRSETRLARSIHP